MVKTWSNITRNVPFGERPYLELRLNFTKEESGLKTTQTLYPSETRECSKDHVNFNPIEGCWDASGCYKNNCDTDVCSYRYPSYTCPVWSHNIQYPVQQLKLGNNQVSCRGNVICQDIDFDGLSSLGTVKGDRNIDWSDTYTKLRYTVPSSQQDFLMKSLQWTTDFYIHGSSYSPDDVKWLRDVSFLYTGVNYFYECMYSRAPFGDLINPFNDSYSISVLKKKVIENLSVFNSCYPTDPSCFVMLNNVIGNLMKYPTYKKEGTKYYVMLPSTNYSIQNIEKYNSYMESFFREKDAIITSQYHKDSWNSGSCRFTNISIGSVLSVNLNTGEVSKTVLPITGNYNIVFFIKLEVSVWSPMLAMLFEKNNIALTDEIRQQVLNSCGDSNNSGLLLKSLYLNSPENMEFYKKKFCGFRYSHPISLYNDDMKNYFVLENSDICSCLSSVNKTVLCFDKNCGGSARDLKGLTDDMCYRECDNVDKNSPMFDNSLYEKICGKDYISKTSSTMNKKVMNTSYIVLLCSCAMIGIAYQKQVISADNSAYLFFGSLIFVLGFGYGLSKDLAGISKCDSDKNSNCYSRYTNMIIPDDFCDTKAVCECESDNECVNANPANSCKCIDGKCVAKSISNRPHTTEEITNSNTNSYVIIYCILSFLFILIGGYIVIPENIILLTVVSSVIFGIMIYFFSTKSNTITVDKTKCCSADCKNKGCGENDGCGGTCGSNCISPNVCYQNSCCLPDQDKLNDPSYCGDVGCGITKTCSDKNALCIDNTCVKRNCVNKKCGEDDGIGGYCLGSEGSCSSGGVCSSIGTCSIGTTYSDIDAVGRTTTVRNTYIFYPNDRFLVSSKTINPDQYIVYDGTFFSVTNPPYTRVRTNDAFPANSIVIINKDGTMNIVNNGKIVMIYGTPQNGAGDVYTTWSTYGSQYPHISVYWNGIRTVYLELNQAWL